MDGIFFSEIIWAFPSFPQMRLKVVLCEKPAACSKDQLKKVLHYLLSVVMSMLKVLQQYVTPMFSAQSPRLCLILERVSSNFLLTLSGLKLYMSLLHRYNKWYKKVEVRTVIIRHDKKYRFVVEFWEIKFSSHIGCQ